MARPLGMPKPDSSRPEKRKHDAIANQSTPNDKKKKKQRLEDNGTPSRGPTSHSAKNRIRRASVTSQPEHFNKKNLKKTGRFSPEEVQILESFKVDICNSYNISPQVFDAIVQGSMKGLSVTISEIREGIYELIPDRDQRSLRRFLRRHFQTGNEPHKWTPEDEDELERLYKKHGTRFALIAREMERTYDDVVQRWKNKVEHRSTMKEGPWDKEETSKLIQMLEKTHEIHKQEGTKNIGKDIYEMSKKHINWGAISDRMGNTRSRQQCADRWRNMKLVVKKRRKNGDPTAVYESRTRASSPKQSWSSKEYVDDNDGSSSDSSGDSESDERSEDDFSEDDDIALHSQLSQEPGKSALKKGTENDSENSPESDQNDASDSDGDSGSDSGSEDDSHSQLSEEPKTKKIPNQVDSNSDSDSDSDGDSDASSNGGDIAFLHPFTNTIQKWVPVNG